MRTYNLRILLLICMACLASCTNDKIIEKSDESFASELSGSEVAPYDAADDEMGIEDESGSLMDFEDESAFDYATAEDTLAGPAAQSEQGSAEVITTNPRLSGGMQFEEGYSNQSVYSLASDEIQQSLGYEETLVDPSVYDPELSGPAGESLPIYANPVSMADQMVDDVIDIDDIAVVGTNASTGFDQYKVVLGVDGEITYPGLPGHLRVWIGNSNFEPSFPETMIQDETLVPAIGESATVKPDADAFVVDPPETACFKIHPSGSEVSFKLTANQAGTFEVGADVKLYGSDDCSGAPVPKSVEYLQVVVTVDNEEIARGKFQELVVILWQKILDFWGALLSLFFALILFLIRGKLKVWFGFEQN